MLRAYAIGQGASTQALLFMIIMAVSGVEPAGPPRDAIMVFAWALNIAIAEILIRRMSAPSSSRSLTARPQ
jgi:hypothetical protein